MRSGEVYTTITKRDPRAGTKGRILELHRYRSHRLRFRRRREREKERKNPRKGETEVSPLSGPRERETERGPSSGGHDHTPSTRPPPFSWMQRTLLHTRRHNQERGEKVPPRFQTRNKPDRSCGPSRTEGWRRKRAPLEEEIEVEARRTRAIFRTSLSYRTRFLRGTKGVGSRKRGWS